MPVIYFLCDLHFVLIALILASASISIPFLADIDLWHCCFPQLLSDLDACWSSMIMTRILFYKIFFDFEIISKVGGSLVLVHQCTYLS